MTIEEKAAIKTDFVPVGDRSMTAEERGMEMMHVPIGKLPALAQAYMRDLCGRVGMCMEVLLTAWTTYAQVAEGLPCTDDLYITPPDERARFMALMDKEPK